MHRIALVITVALAGFALATSSAQAMSCQNRLVLVGDPMVRVLDLCGDPSTVTERVVHRTQQVQRYVSPGVIVTDVVTVSVTLTEWIYDFGPTRFMRGLVFEDGRLRVIDTLGYGTASGRTASIDDGERSVRSAWSELSETRSSGGLGGGAGGAPHREAPKATQAIDARARPLVALPARRYAPSA